MAMRNWKHKIRKGKDFIGNLAAEEGLARAMGEYHVCSTPNYVRERREFEKNVKACIARRNELIPAVVVRKHS